MHMILTEAAKILVLSSGKIDKYEYFTGEEILPFNQRQLIEQAKFTYSPLGKAFEKETKWIGDQGGKIIKATPDDKKQLDNLGNKKQLGNNELLLLKERKIFKNTYNKRLEKIDELSKKIDNDNLLIVVV